MCGISAVYSLSPRPLPSDLDSGTNCKCHEGSQLDRSLDSIKHRGPDARNVWTSDDRRAGKLNVQGSLKNTLTRYLALGHVRLAINDLSSDGEQPFHSGDETVHAVVNGELYDAQQIREQLAEKTGCKFRGRSDCEIVVALYQTYGLSFLRHLRGEFALCIYDSRTKTLIAARDRYGIKPLFFTEVQGRLLVAAEMKAFKSLGWQPEWDVRSILDRGWAHDQRTLLAGVKKIQPGSYFTCDVTGHINHGSYWDLEYPNKYIIDSRPQDELIAGVRERLIEAVRVRLAADVPVGIFLSGGIDSSVIAGIVTHLVREGEKIGTLADLSKIHCYSVAFDKESGFDESEIAERTAEHLGLQLHKSIVDEQVIADNFEEATWHSEHLIADLNYIGKFVLSKAPREQGVKVVLTGEGADEHFAGYPLLFPDYLAESDHSWPFYNLLEDEREKLWTAGKPASSGFFNVKNTTTRGGRSQSTVAGRQLNNVSTLQVIGGNMSGIFSSWVSEFGERDQQETISNNVDGRVRDKMMEEWHPLHTALYIWSRGQLANILLTVLGDRMEMAHSLEARPPFLDHHLTEYVNKLPPSVKIRWDSSQNCLTEKWILREAAKPFVTEEIYKRKKHPYTAPPVYPVGGPLHKLFSRLLTRDNVERLGFIDWKAAEEILLAAFEQQDTASFRAAILLCQWVVLSQRFGIKTAASSLSEEEYTGLQR